MNLITLIIAFLALVALIKWALRLWDGNLPWGTGSRPPLGPAAVLSFVAGCVYLSSFHFEWGPIANYSGRFRGWVGPVTPMDYVERAGEWLNLYVQYANSLHYYVTMTMDLPPHRFSLTYVGIVLLALYGLSAAWRISRDRFRPTFMEEVSLGWFASLGLAPFALVATGLVMAVVILGSLFVVLFAAAWFRAPVRRY